jgi:hypothetical protein
MGQVEGAMDAVWLLRIEGVRIGAATAIGIRAARSSAC